MEEMRIDLDYTTKLLRTQITAYVVHEVGDCSTGLGSGIRG